MDEKPVQHFDAFLEEARHAYPHVTQLLNAVQLLALKMEPMEPFSKGSGNEQFLKLAEAYFVTKYSIDHAEEALRVTLLEPQTKKEVDMNEKEAVIQCLILVRHSFSFLHVPQHLAKSHSLCSPFLPSLHTPITCYLSSFTLQSAGPDTSQGHMGPQSEDH